MVTVRSKTVSVSIGEEGEKKPPNILPFFLIGAVLLASVEKKE